MADPSINLSSKAYYKIMLHCLKHLISDCYGFLIGSLDTKTNKYEVVDAVPFSHDKIFGPEFKVAVTMIKEFYPNEKIIGFYENLILNQMKDDPAISNQSLYVCEIINKNTKINSVYFQVYSKDNDEKGKDYLEDEIFFKEFVYKGEDGFSYVERKNESEEEFKTLKKYLENNRQEDIVDFDDHLEDANKDWRNLFVE